MGNFAGNAHIATARKQGWNVLQPPGHPEARCNYPATAPGRTTGNRYQPDETPRRVTYQRRRTAESDLA